MNTQNASLNEKLRLLLPGLINAGLSYTRQAAVLNSFGLATRTGLEWTGDNVQRVVRSLKLEVNPSEEARLKAEVQVIMAPLLASLQEEQEHEPTP